jgi:hypothetical protein
MTCADIRFINSPNVPELFSDYVILALEAGNVSIRFYRRRPVLKPSYEIADNGRVIGLEEECQEFEGVLQATLTLPNHAAYHLIESLDYLGVKAIYMAETRYQNDK